MKHLEEIIGVNFYEFGFGNEFSDMTLKAWAAKEKNKLDFIKIKKILCLNGHYQENEKTTYGMKENIWISYIWWGFNIQTT